MTFGTQIQSLTGAHSGIYGPAINWADNAVFENSGSYLTRYGLLSGLEEASNTLASLGSSATYPNGMGPDGTLILNGPGAAYVNGIQTIDPTTLTRIAAGAYSPAVTYGGGDITGVLVGSQLYSIDCGTGGPVAGTHKIIISQDATVVYTDAWPTGSNGGTLCAGPSGSNTVYLATAPTSSADSPQQVDIQAYICGISISKSTIVTLDPTDIDAGWTEIYFGGFCLDQTDNNLLAFFSGQSGASPLSKLVKIDATTGDVLWTHTITNNGSNPAGGSGVMKNSSITNGQYGYVCTAGTPTITIVDTSDGSTISTQTTGLHGLTMVSASGCYNDTLGCIVGVFGYTYADADSPARLNSTPSSFSGYGALYIAPGVSPGPGPGGGAGHRRWIAAIRSYRAAA